MYLRETESSEGGVDIQTSLGKDFYLIDRDSVIQILDNHKKQLQQNVLF